MPLVEVYFLRRIDAVSEEAFILGGVGIDTWTVLEGLYLARRISKESDGEETVYG